MAEEKSHLGLWALLALLAGGGIFAATKLFVLNKNKNSLQTNNSTQNNNNTTVSNVNDATKVGLPYSVDLTLFVNSGVKVLNHLANFWTYNKKISSEKRADGWYLSGQSVGQIGKWYVYSLTDGSFIGVYTNSKTCNTLSCSSTSNNTIQAFTGYK